MTGSRYFPDAAERPIPRRAHRRVRLRSRWPTPSLWPATIVGAIVAVTTFGCGSPTGSCALLAIDGVASERLDEWQAMLDFTPVTPCGGSSLRVSQVTLDRPHGEPRVTFVVSADRRSVFLMSQSRAVRAFTQVPDGATRLSWSVDGLAVTGFEGPGGAAPALLYLRWEVEAVVHEFQGNVSRRYSLPALRAIAHDNIARTSVLAEREP